MDPRGPRPDDVLLFGGEALGRLCSAASEMAWLIDRGYPLRSAIAFVGDHHQLVLRQRQALSRGMCSEARKSARAARRLSLEAMRGADVVIDGFNLLVTLEVALSGGLIVIGRDGAMRDLAGMRGGYRMVSETDVALDRVAALFERYRPASVTWFFDAPVSHSGELRAHVGARGWPVKTEARVVPSADHALVALPHVVSADAAVLDACASWHELTSALVESANASPAPRILRLFADCERGRAT